MGITSLAPTKVPFWLDAPDAWDTVSISDGNGLALSFPGVCKISGTGTARLDKKTTHGADNATVEYLGADPFKFTLTCTVCDADELSELQGCVDMLRASTKKTALLPRHPIDIRSAQLDMHGIYQAMVEEISIIDESKSYAGCKELTVKFTQFFPAVNTLITTKITSTATVAGFAPQLPLNMPSSTPAPPPLLARPSGT
jgi:hypothetical protein